MGPEILALDHVVLGVPDVEDAAALLLVRHGLVALAGGEHPAWGTRNRIVPLGDCYLEIVDVVDEDVASSNPFGTWVAAMARGEAGWGWAVRTSDLEATAARLGLDVVPGARVRADGVRLSWRLAGVPRNAFERMRPFFIAWDEGTPLPGLTPVPHPCGPVALTRVTATGDGIADWLGAPIPLVDVGPGVGGISSIVLASAQGDIAITAPWDLPGTV
jgi:hypothetical protein